MKRTKPPSQPTRIMPRRGNRGRDTVSNTDAVDGVQSNPTFERRRCRKTIKRVATESGIGSDSLSEFEETASTSTRNDRHRRKRESVDVESSTRSQTSPLNEVSASINRRGVCESPELGCSICLGAVENRAFTDACYHSFCFECLVEWSRVRAVCPLCKKSFNSIIHSFRSYDDYKLYQEYSQHVADHPELVESVLSLAADDCMVPGKHGRIPSSQDDVDEPACSMEDVIQLLQLLSAIASDTQSTDVWENLFNVSTEEFFSKKITNKLVQQLQDALVLASSSMPDWCRHLTISCPLLFPFETRQLYFNATAFGASRSIVWLQNKRDATLERLRGPSPRREDAHEFRVGRLKHERVCVPRDDSLLEWAMQVMKYHAERKAVLEIEFRGEEGTGLGPTLEFFALVAAELQRKDLGLWLCDDDFIEQEREVDYGRGTKAAGYYVQYPSGLFPAPLPQTDYDRMPDVEILYRCIGTLFAKCIQDSRLVDIPLSRPLLKLMCGGDMSDAVSHTRSCGSVCVSRGSDEEDLTPTEPMITPPMNPWFTGQLSMTDFDLLYPHRAQFLRELSAVVAERRLIEADTGLADDDKHDKIRQLTVGNSNTTIDDIGLTFVFNPSSKVYNYTSVELKPNGENEIVTIDNVVEYIDLVTDFCLNVGICRQMEALKAGFDQVFPMEKLFLFSPTELQMILCGDQSPQWTKDDIVNYTEPKLGYTRESPGFQRLVNVLVGMSGDERKAFLQFTTGCSSLPPGGLANLQPRLTVVRKVDSTDGGYPSVNTCVHYLKLPEYSSEEILRDRLLAATKEKGFHLN